MLFLMGFFIIFWYLLCWSAHVRVSLVFVYFVFFGFFLLLCYAIGMVFVCLNYVLLVGTSVLAHFLYVRHATIFIFLIFAFFTNFFLWFLLPFLLVCVCCLLSVLSSRVHVWEWFDANSVLCNFFIFFWILSYTIVSVFICFYGVSGVGTFFLAYLLSITNATTIFVLIVFILIHKKYTFFT